MRLATRVFALVLLVSNCVYSRIFTACELAFELAKPEHNVSLWQIPTWVCIARHASSFDTAYNDGVHYGIFRIWGHHWCKECNINCHKLTDDDLTDDIRCVVHKVFPAHSRHGRANGFDAWGHIYQYCHKPWMDLEDSHCTPHFDSDISNTSQTSHIKILHHMAYDQESYDNYDEEARTVDFTENPPDNTTESDSSGSRKHHILPSDAGLLLFVLLCVLLTGAVIEGYRRSGLHIFRMCS
uniref:lysozyme n=1 Tax=Lygus hesperus TaxID=30085 RepID=A0A0A9YFL1_LYGHE